MKEDILKTLMGLGAITLILFASIGFWITYEKLFPPKSELPKAGVQWQITVDRPEEIQKAIDLPLDPVTEEEFRLFQLQNGLIDDQVD